MSKNCLQCQNTYEISDQDLAFYAKISFKVGEKIFNLPVPTLCPDCRLQRRLGFRNERNLSVRQCDLTGKKFIALYSPEKKYRIYCQEAWLGDGWDPMQYGKDFDFQRNFFDQFQQLFSSVPHPGVGLQSNCENCDYTVYQNDSKNCYLTTGSGFMEECGYTNWTYYAQHSYDTLGARNIEWCYELVDCQDMHASSHCQDSAGLSECSWCFDCQSCQNCFGCVGLRHKKFCFFNEQLSEKMYREMIENVDL